MNNLIPLKYCLDFNQSGGNQSDSTEFIPYSDHYKMTEEKRIAKPMFCPDIAPFKCSKKSNGAGTCQLAKHNCTKKIIEGSPQKYPIIYIPKKYSKHLEKS